MSDIDSNLPVKDVTDGTPGSAAPALGQQIAGNDGTNLRVLSTDTTGKVNINNISGTVSLPTSAATSTKQSDGTQKTQVVDASGNVQPSGDVLTRKIFVQPTDGSNNQGYTASSEAKVLVTPLTNTSVVKAQLQDNAGNALTSQVSGTQRPLDVGVNVLGVQVDPRTLFDTQSNTTAQIDPLRGAVASAKNRLFGDSFADGIGMGEDVGTFPDTVTVTGSATGGVVGGYLQLNTVNSSNGNSAIYQSIRFALFLTSSVSAFQSGIVLPASPTAFRVVSRIASVDTQVNSGSFNVATTVVPDGLFHRYEIFFQGAGTAQFAADGIVLHRMSGQVATPRTGTLDLPLRYEIVTAAGVTTARFGMFTTTDGYFFEVTYAGAAIILGVRGSTAYRLGPINISDKNSAWTISALNGAVTITPNGAANIYMSITGTWVATLNLQADAGDGVWASVLGKLPYPSGALAASIGSNVQLKIPCAGMRQVRIIATAYTSGTATVTWNAGTGTGLVEVFNFDAPSLQTTSRLNDGSGNSVTSTAISSGSKQALSIKAEYSPLTAAAPATVSAGVTSGTLIASNANRKGLVVINTSTLGTISLNLVNGSAVLNSGITLYPHDVWYMDGFTFTTAQINVIASLAATSVGLQELT